MILALDIGNTNITFGVFRDGDDGGEASRYSPSDTWRISTEMDRMADEYGLILNNLLSLRGISTGELTAAVMCSGVPPLTPTFVGLLKTYLGLEPLVVGAGVKTGVKVLYDTPRDVGADRIVDAVAAIKLYGGPAVVVDFGTATVFDAISARSEYLGGAIAPGMAVAADALIQNTSQLRRVELDRPPEAIGKNTIHAIQSGLVFGYAEMVKGMVARFDNELGGGSKVVATGGLAELMAKEVDIFDAVNLDLTLAGLRIVHDMNS